MKPVYTLLFLSAMTFFACNTPGYTTNGQSMTSNSNGDARNWVMIMHGESCGSADDVASNMYVENNHETATISVTVDISWTENGQVKHENRNLLVGPDSKALIGCDYRNGIFLKMEIVNAQFN